MPRLIYLTEFSATAYWTEVQVGCDVWTGSALRAFKQCERGRGTVVAFHVPLRIHCSQPPGSSSSCPPLIGFLDVLIPSIAGIKKKTRRSGLFKWMVFGLIGQTCQPLFSRVPFSIFMDTRQPFGTRLYVSKNRAHF
jgi:hypothetical protein